MKFEYLIGRVAGPDLVEVQARLDKFGRDGWELVGIELTQVPRNQVERQDTSGIFIFKRCIIPPELAAGIRRDFIFPECERCWQWDHEKGCLEMEVVSRRKGRCSHWTFSKPAEPAEDPENAGGEPAEENNLRPNANTIVGLGTPAKKIVSELDNVGESFIFPECKRCKYWRHIKGCAKNVTKGRPDCEERCIRWTIPLPATEPVEDHENEQARPGARQTIWPLFLGDVAVCTGGHCEQFNIAKYECELAGPTGSGAVCSVWYKRKDKVAPCGTAEFVLSRVLLNPGSENNWEPLVKKVEEAMDDFAHYESHSTRTEARRAVVEIVLRAVEDVDGGFRVLKRFSKGSLP